MDIREGIDFPQGSFDLITCIELFWYIIPDIQTILDNLKTLLRPSGFFFASLYMPEAPIGKEVIPDSAACVELVSNYFTIHQVVKYLGKGDNEHIMILARKE